MKKITVSFYPLWVNTVSFLLIVLFIYAAVSKLLDFSHFKWEMHNQELFPFLQMMLIYLLPASELFIVALLAVVRIQTTGLYASVLLIALFTGYTFLVIMHVFKRVPCSCGGILEHMGWPAHFIFNAVISKGASHHNLMISPTCTIRVKITLRYVMTC